MPSDTQECLRLFMETKFDVLRPYKACAVALMQEAVDPHSALNPLSAQSAAVLDQSTQILERLLERCGEKEARKISKALWVAHMALLFAWLQDHSDEERLTRRLLERFCQLPRLLKMGRFLPGLDDLLETASAFVSQSAPCREVQVEPEVCTFDCDVAVIGGGPIGLLYACWLKQARPQTQVVILEKSTSPSYKVGESTLSGFCKALRSIGIPHQAMQRLFYPKNGLGFFSCLRNEHDIERLPEYILETFDETFQVEREMLETLMMERARDLGVRILRGARTDLNSSNFQATSNQLHYRIGDRRYSTSCKLVVDASGPAALLARHHGLYTRSGLTFQTGAVWSAFRTDFSLDNLVGWSRTAQFPRDQYTQHFCFPEGWMWYIPTFSWSQAPLQNRQELCRDLLSDPTPPERDILGNLFACPHEQILSLGLVLRDDRDTVLKDDPASAFEYYSQKYPALGNVLCGSTLLKDYLGENKSFSSRLNLRGWSRQVTGDGWLCIGDAAFFVDPLISPGMTAGAATAFYAFQETLRAFDSECWSRQEFGRYEEFAHRLHQAHERDSQIVSMSFNHPRSLALVQRFQEIDSRRHFEEHQDNDYSLADTNVWGLLKPEYQSMQKTVWDLMLEHEHMIDARIPLEEQSPDDYRPMVEQMERTLRPYLDENSRLNPYVLHNETEVVC